MSLPGDGTLTDPALPADWAWPMRPIDGRMTDYEMGGPAFQDGSSLTTQLWSVVYENEDVKIIDEAGNETTAFHQPNVSELALAFDQSMNPFVAYVVDQGPEEGAHYWWYDTIAQAMVTSDLPNDVQYPRACIDEHRESQRDVSDIILTYQRGDTLCYRQQRDRFDTEYQFSADLAGLRLLRVGMSVNYRLQWQFAETINE